MKQTAKLYIGKIGIALGVYLTLRFLLPLVLPFFLAWMTVCGLSSLSKKMQKKLFPVTIAFLLILLLLFLLIIWSSYTLLCAPCQNLYRYFLMVWNTSKTYFSDVINFLSNTFLTTMPSVFSWAFGLFLYFLSIPLIAKDWETLKETVEKLSFWKPLTSAGRRIAGSLQGWFHAQVKIMFLVTLECAVGYWFFKIPGAGLWAVLTGFIDALPVFGTGTIFVPWMIYLFFLKDYSFLIQIGILYFITWLTRQFLEPRLLADGIGLMPIYFLISVILGLKLFGAAGFLTGPFGVLFIRELWAELENSVLSQNSSVSSSVDEQK